MGGRTIETEFIEESERGYKYDPATVYHKDKYMIVHKPQNNFLPKKGAHHKVFSTDQSYATSLGWDTRTPAGNNHSSTQKNSPDPSKQLLDLLQVENSKQNKTFKFGRSGTR